MLSICPFSGEVPQGQDAHRKRMSHLSRYYGSDSNRGRLLSINMWCKHALRLHDELEGAEGRSLGGYHLSDVSRDLAGGANRTSISVLRLYEKAFSSYYGWLYNRNILFVADSKPA